MAQLAVGEDEEFLEARLRILLHFGPLQNLVPYIEPCLEAVGALRRLLLKVSALQLHVRLKAEGTLTSVNVSQALELQQRSIYPDEHVLAAVALVTQLLQLYMDVGQQVASLLENGHWERWQLAQLQSELGNVHLQLSRKLIDLQLIPFR